MSSTPDSPAKIPDDRTTQGGNYWTLFTPGIWKLLHAVLHPESSYDVPYQVQLSALRYEPTLAEPAMPSPVTPHQDAVDGAIVVLHKTANLVGGHSRIHDLRGAPQWQVDLEPGDALFVRDAQVLHQVAPILLEPGPRWVPDEPAHRDVLLVRFQKVGR